MNDMKHFSDNISGFFVCRPFPPSEGVQKTQKNARLRKVGKVRRTGKCGDRHFSWRCCICPPSEGVRKTQETARLRKVGRVWWTGKCGESQFSWRCCICPPSEGVQKTRETAHLRKVGKVRWMGKCGDRQLSGRYCICSPSEGVRKTQVGRWTRRRARKWVGGCLGGQAGRQTGSSNAGGQQRVLGSGQRPL